MNPYQNISMIGFQRFLALNPLRLWTFSVPFYPLELWRLAQLDSKKNVSISFLLGNSLLSRKLVGSIQLQGAFSGIALAIYFIVSFGPIEE